MNGFIDYNISGTLSVTSIIRQVGVMAKATMTKIEKQFSDDNS